ncbi:solute carrier family 2, facilitated glucose transporter member 8-like isoform X2 [Ciona intestinalis]
MEDNNENIESTRLLKDRNYDDGSKIPVFIYSGIMILGAVSTGTVLGLSAPMIPLMQKDNSSNAIHVGTSEASWIGSLLMLGGMVGGGFAGIFMQHFGRKATAIVSGVPYIGGLLLISFATNIWMVYAGRVITGVAMAFTSLVVPTAGFKTTAQLYMASLLVSGMQVLFTAVSCLLIDRTGRRVLLGFSGGVMALSMVAFGLYFQLTYAEHKGNLNWLALSSMMVYIVAFSLGLGPIPWVLMAELIPLRGRAKCGGLVTTFNLFFAFITTKEFQDLVNATSRQATFWMFGGVCATIILYAVFLLPETKGRTLEEIEQHFQRHENYESLGGATEQDIAPAT